MSAARSRSTGSRHSVSGRQTDIDDLLHCEVIISMLPDDAAARDVVLGRRDLGMGGLAAGLIQARSICR